MARLLNWVLDIILRNPLLFWACVIVNFLGALYGVFVWYRPALDAAPPWAWIFIPVCPLAALAGSGALLGLRYHQRWPAYYALTALACIKWGIWTLLFWSRQWIGSGVINPMEVALFIAHIGLICEGILFVPRIGPLSTAGKLAVLGWFWFSFYVHYGLGFYPPLTSHVSEPYILWLSTVLLVVLSAGLVALPMRALHTPVGAPVGRSP